MFKKKLIHSTVLFTAAIFSACGDDPLNNSESFDVGDSVKTMEDLFNCTDKREGETAYVEEFSATYVCSRGTWVLEPKRYESMEDLFNCTSKRDGEIAYVEEKDKTYTCKDGTWVDENGLKSSSSGKGSSSSKKIESSSSEKSKSCSSNATRSSSSYVDSKKSSASSSASSSTGTSASSSTSSSISSSAGSSTSSSTVFSSSVVTSSSAKSSSSSNAVSSSSQLHEIGIGALTDSRDGQTYKTTVIGTQTWMAENLNYETTDSYCYNDSVVNCNKNGRLYGWNDAMDACPSGWRLPTKADIETLFTAVGGEPIADRMLKATSGWTLNGWKSAENGLDTYSFSARPTGYGWPEGGFDASVFDMYFWTSSDDRNLLPGLDFRWCLWISYERGHVQIVNRPMDYKLSVRCIKDDPVNQNPVACTSSDKSVYDAKKNTLEDYRNCKVYRTAVIGSQTWMAQNLDYKTANSYCYNDDTTNCIKYGRLYKWNKALEVCPSGWRLPTKDDFDMLVKSAAGSFYAGKMLKAAMDWKEGGSGRDSCFFTALPAGYYQQPFYYNLGSTAIFWSSTEVDSSKAYDLYLGYSSDNVQLKLYGSKTYDAYSVRCIKKE